MRFLKWISAAEKALNLGGSAYYKLRELVEYATNQDHCWMGTNGSGAVDPAQVQEMAKRVSMYWQKNNECPFDNISVHGGIVSDSGKHQRFYAEVQEK